MKRWWVLVVVMSMLLGCSGNDVKLNVKANGSRQDVIVGQILVISLAANPSTGYGWQVQGDLPGMLEQVGEPEFKAGLGSIGRVGAGGTQVIRFRVLKSGTATVTLGYMRSWEDVPPLETFTLNLVAQSS